MNDTLKRVMAMADFAENKTLKWLEKQWDANKFKNFDNQPSFVECAKAENARLMPIIKAQGEALAVFADAAKKLRGDVYLSALEMSAWLGIPEHKRENYVKYYVDQTVWGTEKVLSEAEAKLKGLVESDI